MNSNKLTAKITGVLFILGFAGILTAAFTRSILGDPDYLSKISANENPVIWAAFFQFIMGSACAGIGISLYPVLKKYNEGLALGSAGFRIIEGGIYIVGVIGLFLLLTLSREFTKADHPDPSYFQIAGTLLLSLRDWVLLTGTLAWCIGAAIYYSVFYRTKLIPRWLSGWGLVGIALAWAAGMLVMFHLDTSMSTIQGMLNLPIALQEMTLAIWLIVRGFNPLSIAFATAKVEMN